MERCEWDSDLNVPFDMRFMVGAAMRLFVPEKASGHKTDKNTKQSNFLAKHQASDRWNTQTHTHW